MHKYIDPFNDAQWKQRNGSVMGLHTGKLKGILETVLKGRFPTIAAAARHYKANARTLAAAEQRYAELLAKLSEHRATARLMAAPGGVR